MPEKAFRRKQGFRDLVYDAALHLFATRGIHGMSMRALAQVMGTSTMKTYHYFRDKDEVLAEVLTRTYDRFCNTLDQAVATADTPAARMQALADAYTGFACQAPESYHVLFELTAPEGDAYPQMMTAMSRLPALIHNQAEELVGVEAATKSADALAAALWSSLHGVVCLYLSGKLPQGVRPEDVAHMQLDALLAGTPQASAALRSPAASASAL